MSMIMLRSDTDPPSGDIRGMSQQSHSDPLMPDIACLCPVNCVTLSLCLTSMLAINPGLRDILRRAVTTQRVARYWSLLHRSIVAELNMKLRLNSFFSMSCSTHDRDSWKLGCVLLKHRGIRVITDGCHWSVCPNHILIDRRDTGLANNGRDTAHIVWCQAPGETFNYWHWLTMGKHGADERWEIRARLWPSRDKCVPVNRESLWGPERQILTESVSSISIEACFMWVCWWDTALVFWQKVPLLFLWPPVTMIKTSSISNKMFIRVYSSRLLWYQIDVLRCNSILSESCLVSSNKLAWLSPDPGLWYGALSSGNEIINIIARTRDSSLRKSYLYCKIGSHEKIGRRSWRTTWLTRNNLHQMVNSF